MRFRSPSLPQGPIVRATLLHRSGFAAAAEALLRALLEERPDDPKLLTQIGDLRLEAGDRDGARALYDRALAADDAFAYASFRRGLLAEAEGDPESAVLFHNRAVALAHPATEGAAMDDSDQPNTLSEKERADGWKLLFDGKTTKGWRGFKRTASPTAGRQKTGH